jgi:hypothetical protein
MTTAASTNADSARDTLGNGEGRAASGSSQAESAKPITITLPDDILKKLKIIAILRSTSVSEVLSDAAVSVVRRDLKKVLGKLGE